MPTALRSLINHLRSRVNSNFPWIQNIWDSCKLECMQTVFTRWNVYSLRCLVGNLGSIRKWKLWIYLLNSWRVSPPPKNFWAVVFRSMASSILLVPCQKAGIMPITAFTKIVFADSKTFCTSGASNEAGSTSTTNWYSWPGEKSCVVHVINSEVSEWKYQKIWVACRLYCN